jgi:hypothetical protein
MVVRGPGGLEIRRRLQEGAEKLLFGCGRLSGGYKTITHCPRIDPTAVYGDCFVLQSVSPDFSAASSSLHHTALLSGGRWWSEDEAD